MQNKKSTIQIQSYHEYTQRVYSIIDFIEKNLEIDLSLHFLSQKACFSPFHFHRIFLQVTGEPLHIFIVRKRIEKIASILLTGTNKPFHDLAYTYGFSSGNSFCRAFKKYYGIAPSDYKEHFSKIGVEVLTYEKYICHINKIKNKKNELSDNSTKSF